ncbi:MAG TPA: hypothetical protein VM510_11230 [Caulifigura sp.]|nr:hypothetical protein [Caulifigura sp.]
MNPRGLPVENVSIQILNFLNRANRSQGPGLTAPSKESSRIEFDQVRIAVDRAPVQEVELPIDGAVVRGTRTDALDAAVVELNWHGQAVFITGRPSALEAIALRTATPADVDHL